MAVTTLLKLAGYTNKLRYVEVAHQELAQMQPMMSQYPLGFGQWLQALGYALSKPREIAIVGDPENADRRALLRVIRDGYRSPPRWWLWQRPALSRLPSRSCKIADLLMGKRLPMCAADLPAVYSSLAPVYILKISTLTVTDVYWIRRLSSRPNHFGLSTCVPRLSGFCTAYPGRITHGATRSLATHPSKAFPEPIG
jgi:hypothetical protein